MGTNNSIAVLKSVIEYAPRRIIGGYIPIPGAYRLAATIVEIDEYIIANEGA
jgi:hypothetical protein